MSQTDWDRFFLKLALVHAEKSKDPSTKVGAVITDFDHVLISGGYNGFPRGIQDTHERLTDREAKLKLVVHAEMNAVLAAARKGTQLLGTTLYIVALDAASGATWGGAPCVRCTVEVIQAGIHLIVAPPMDLVPDRWRDSILESRRLLLEAGIEVREVEL